ncbi:MAG: hypothetical protein ACT4NU_12270 [Chromatiales bacterium]
MAQRLLAALLVIGLSVALLPCVKATAAAGDTTHHCHPSKIGDSHKPCNMALAHHCVTCGQSAIAADNSPRTPKVAQRQQNAEPAASVVLAAAMAVHWRVRAACADRPSAEPRPPLQTHLKHRVLLI